MKYLPEPNSFKSKTTCGGNDFIMITPYNSMSWTNVANKMGVQVPDIIDMTHGKSKCQQCGALYSGHQPRCDANVTFHRPPGAWNDKYGYHPNYENYIKTCDGYLIWELRAEFEIQRQLFSLLEEISKLSDLELDPLVKFSKHFPHGVPDVVRVRLMQERLCKMTYDINDIKRALNTIADKMNVAGVALKF